jgi:hypothetical protein
MDRLKNQLVILTQALSCETDNQRRRVLLHRLNRKLLQISAIEDHVISPREAYDGEYWRNRADRTKRLAKKHRNEDVRRHFAKIADGYLELAKRADDLKQRTAQSAESIND